MPISTIGQKLGTIYVDIKGRADKLENELKRLEHRSEKQADSIGRRFGQRFASAAATAIKYGTIAIVTSLSAILVKSVKTAASFESMRFRLEQLTGSAEKAKNLFRDLVAFSAKTPFSPSDVVEAAATLEAFGASAEKTIRPVADLAAFMGIDLPQAASAFGRAFAAGAGAADILRERGVLTLIKNAEKIDDLTKLTLPQFQKALLNAMTDPSGRIVGGAERLSKTLEGKWSTFVGNIQILMANLGEVILPTVNSWVLKLNEQLEKLTAGGGATGAYLEAKKKILEAEIKSLQDQGRKIKAELDAEEKAAASRSLIDKIFNTKDVADLKAQLDLLAGKWAAVTAELEKVNEQLTKLKSQPAPKSMITSGRPEVAPRTLPGFRGGPKGDARESVSGKFEAGLFDVAAINQRLEATDKGFKTVSKTTGDITLKTAFWLNQLDNVSARVTSILTQSLKVKNVFAQMAIDFAAMLAQRALFSALAVAFNPGASFSKIFFGGGFQHGGSMTVPGVDTGRDDKIVVAKARGGERVDFTPPGGVSSGGAMSVTILAPELHSIDDDFIFRTRIMPKIRRELGR